MARGKNRMKRAQLEHLIRAAAVIADDDELVVIGSQAILAQFPDAPDVLLVSVEAISIRRTTRNAPISSTARSESSLHFTIHSGTTPKAWVRPPRFYPRAGKRGWSRSETRTRATRPSGRRPCRSRATGARGFKS